jgi:type IV pilus assembly protein PilM
MPAHTKTIALNLGMQTLTAAEFDITPDGGVCLNRFADFELMVDPAADITRNEQIKAGIGELLKSLHVKKGFPAMACLPSQAVFTRFVRLPGATPSDVADVIPFEAQQNVPFPIDEVVWDFQILGSQRDDNWDVALVAIKSDQLEDVYEATLEGGVSCQTIDLAPTALYNAFRFNYSELQGTSLLIDMGARTTNLIFIDGDKLFSRTIPIGGTTISTNISKELNLDVTAADTIKKDKGYVALGGAYADNPDPTIAKISKVARTAMTRLHAEIMRSISYYRSSQGGSQPMRAFLCGGAMGMTYMHEFFAEKLQMPVDFFNPLRNVTVATPQVAAAIEGKIHTLGDTIGVALRQMGNVPVEINLRPPRMRQQQEFARRRPALIAAILCAAAALFGLHMYFTTAAGTISEVAAGVQNDVNRLQGIAAEIAKAQQEKQKLEALAAPFLLAAEERSIWLGILDAMSSAIPPRYIWVTKLTPLSGGTPVSIESLAAPAGTGQPRGRGQAPQRPGEQESTAPTSKSIDAIRIGGLYLENPQMLQVVDSYVDNLAKSPLFKVDGAVKTNMTRTQPDGTRWAYGFEFVLPLATPIALPQP